MERDAQLGTEIDISAVMGFTLMVGETDSFIIDERNRIAIVKTYGIGGGFGMSAGIGTSSGSGRKDVKTMEGTSVKIGASIHGIGFEMDDKGSYSASAWKIEPGGDFHATINYTIVIILWEREPDNED